MTVFDVPHLGHEFRDQHRPRLVRRLDDDRRSRGRGARTLNHRSRGVTDRLVTTRHGAAATAIAERDGIDRARPLRSEGAAATAAATEQMSHRRGRDGGDRRFPSHRRDRDGADGHRRQESRPHQPLHVLQPQASGIGATAKAVSIVIWEIWVGKPFGSPNGDGLTRFERSRPEAFRLGGAFVV